MTLWHEISEISSTRHHLRQFGLTMGIAFGLIGGFLTWKAHAPGPFFLGAAVFFAVFGFLLPQALKPVQKIWMTLAFLMGWVMSRVVLIMVFFVTFTPIALVLRLSGKDLLDIRTAVSAPSYWKKHKTREKKDYELQF